MAEQDGSGGQRMAGKVVLVTGAARGIGRAVAEAMLAEGARVALSDVLEEPQVAQSLGENAAFFQADVSDDASVEAMLTAVCDRFGGIDVLVNNAAFSDRGPFLEVDLPNMRRTVEVTMWGAFRCLQGVCRRMVRRGRGGAVVIVSSPHAVVPVPNHVLYNMAKAGLDMMARTVATEMLPHGIRINMIHPGWTDTPGERKFFTEDDLRSKSSQIPLGRLIDPSEIARLAVMLADDRSECVNGATLVADGGLQLPWKQLL